MGWFETGMRWSDQSRLLEPTFSMALAYLFVVCSLLTGCRDGVDTAQRDPDAYDLVNSISMPLKQISSGTFLMGSSVHQPQHQVNLTDSFYVGVFEVTQAEFEAVMGKNPSQFVGATRPVDSVTWTEAKLFCRRLSQMPDEVAAGRKYRLPTEAEWEYCCRAGVEHKFNFGRDARHLPEYAWVRDNSKSGTHAVGTKKPNQWGLYDTNGNVWEWCHDWFGQYKAGPVDDPVGTSEGKGRVARGGGWDDYEYQCQSAYRIWCDPTLRSSGLGFRVVMTRE